MTNILGALKPKVDTRDYQLRAGASNLPDSYVCVDLPPVKNQRSVCSCVAHATAAILEFFNKKETGTFIPLSTNFIYGMQGVAFKRLESGMYLRDACKIVKKYGDAPEATVGGNTEQPKCTQELENKLNESVYDKAKEFKIKSYALCKKEKDIKYALFTSGPVLASIKWYDKYSLKADKTIEFNKKTNYGYHAIMIYGYNEYGWLCQNSWGRNWNKDGRFILPYSEKFQEAWTFIDATSEEIYIPINNSIFDILYKGLNILFNLIKKLV